MSDDGPVDLFVYGTLAYDRTMRALTGRIFPKRPCVLRGYRRVTPPYGYAYIVPQEGETVQGWLVEGIPRAQLAALDAYEAEGDMYRRLPVTCVRGGEARAAYAYAANPDRIARYFGDGEPAAVDAAVLVDEILEEEAARLSGRRPGPEEMIALRELLGGTIEELCAASRGGRPPGREEIRRALRHPGIPTLAPLKRPDHPARLYAAAYLRLAVRHIVFSHTEARILSRFGDLVAAPEGFYAHAASACAALDCLNRNGSALERLIERDGCGTLRDEREYLDHAVQAIAVAARLFDANDAAATCRLAVREAQPGSAPLGAELEFSPLGVAAIGAAPGMDPEFDGFHWAADFDLLRRGWKLGMHVDTHRAVCLPGERCRGFLEYALGRLRIAGDLSMPVTNDPRLLASLIRGAAAFCGVRPHSLHLSIEIPPGLRGGPPPRLSDLLCLLLLGGDLRRNRSGALREMRIHNREIEDSRGGLYFSRENLHSSDGEIQSEVIEYQFPRLRTGRDFTPLIVALKGFQFAGNPPPVNPFMDGDYRPDQPLLRELKRWAASPSPLPDEALSGFLGRVEEGLQAEASGAPGHTPAFIRDALASISCGLREANGALC
jgi:gamma-glutamylcyclotransferase (GGCT)/AIG2-like uncharacterized protein YtfP